MDDYYDLLGVEPGADTADIKTAYRDKKAALDAKGDKSQVARVNKAWNVLSDPYQRGRYDAQREAASETGELVAAAPAASTEPPPRRRGLFQPPPSGDRPPPQPTIEPPAGFTMASQRARVMAMVIDLVVLAVFVVGAQIALPTLLENRYPDQVDLINDMSDPLADLTDAQNDFDDAQDDLNKLQDNADATDAEIADAQQKVDDAQATLDDKEAAAQPFLDRCNEKGFDTKVTRDAGDNDPVTLADQLKECDADARADTQGFVLLVIEGAFLLSLIYLIVPSALTGQTLGKRLRGIKVIRL